jgi:hypothetical protein
MHAETDFVSLKMMILMCLKNLKISMLVGGWRGEVCTGFWWGNLRERDRWRDPGVDGKIILGWIFRKWDVGLWTGMGWLRIGTGGGRL